MQGDKKVLWEKSNQADEVFKRSLELCHVETVVATDPKGRGNSQGKAGPRPSDFQEDCA